MLLITHMGQGGEYQPQNCECLTPDICLHNNILHRR